MAVYERTWRRYDGPLTSGSWRWLVITRDALRDVFASKFFLFCYFVAMLPTVFIIISAFATQKMGFLEQIGITKEFIDAWMLNAFYTIFPIQTFLAFFLALIVAPNLVIPDFNDSALPLYLSRPIERRDYVIGKLAVMIVVLSPVTWIGSTLAFIVQAVYEGSGWWYEHFRVELGHLVGHLTWIIVISLLSLAIAAWVRYKFLARAILLAMLAMLTTFDGIIYATIRTNWGALVDIAALIVFVVLRLFNPVADVPIPIWCAWTMLTVVSVLSLLMLLRKIKAHEVIR